MGQTRRRVVVVIAVVVLGGAGLGLWSTFWSPDPPGLPPHSAASPAVARSIAVPVSTQFLPPHLGFEPEPVEVAIEENGRTWFRGREVGEGDLAAAVATDRGPAPGPGAERPLLIRADSGTRCGSVLAVVSAVAPLCAGSSYLVVRSETRVGESAIRLRSPTASGQEIAKNKARIRLRPRESGEMVATCASLGVVERRIEGAPAIRRLLRSFRQVRDGWEFDPVEWDCDPDVPLADVVAFLDMLTPYERAGRHQAFSLPPEVPVRAVVDSSSDDRHAILLLVALTAVLVLLGLFAGAPAEIGTAFTLKVPVALLLATGLREIGKHAAGDAVWQWAIPVSGALALWLFAGSRLVRWTAPSALLLAALFLTLEHDRVLEEGWFVGDPVWLAEHDAPSTREERLWHAATMVEDLRAESPPGPLVETTFGTSLRPGEHRFLDRAGKVEVKAAPCWHTFLTGLYRIVPADPDLVVWYPGGPAREAADRLEFRNAR